MAHAITFKPGLHGTLSPVNAAGDLVFPAAFIKSALVKLNNWRINYATRQQLRMLPDYLLEDIGISRYEIDNFKVRS
jgi:uncharacterized protein YjiS (DUF1127 family)